MGLLVETSMAAQWLALAGGPFLGRGPGLVAHWAANRAGACWEGTSPSHSLSAFWKVWEWT